MPLSALDQTEWRPPPWTHAGVLPTCVQGTSCPVSSLWYTHCRASYEAAEPDRMYRQEPKTYFLLGDLLDCWRHPHPLSTAPCKCPPQSFPWWVFHYRLQKLSNWATEWKHSFPIPQPEQVPSKHNAQIAWPHLSHIYDILFIICLSPKTWGPRMEHNQSLQSPHKTT